LLEEGGLGYLIYSPSLSDPASLKDSSFAWLESLSMLSMSILVWIHCPEQNQCEAMVRNVLHFRTGLERACYHRTNKQAGVSVVGLIIFLGGTSHS
jgi:hypothetical protein